jgi:hypothetical protein
MFGVTGISDARKIKLAADFLSAKVLFGSLASLGWSMAQNANRIIEIMASGSNVTNEQIASYSTLMAFSGIGVGCLGSFLYTAHVYTSFFAVWSFSNADIRSEGILGAILDFLLYKILAILLLAVSAFVGSGLWLLMTFYAFYQ